MSKMSSMRNKNPGMARPEIAQDLRAVDVTVEGIDVNYIFDRLANRVAPLRSYLQDLKD